MQVIEINYIKATLPKIKSIKKFMKFKEEHTKLVTTLFLGH